jgi:hypothetical protein
MGDQDFWSWNGGVQAISSDDVKQSVFNGGINRLYLTHCTATLNRAKKQARFYYPSNSSIENDSGKIFHFDQQCFSVLKFGRTAAIDANLLASPVSSDTSGIIYYDESGTDANGVALPYLLEFGGMDISNGDRNADIFGFIPDFQYQTGAVNLNILTKYYPGDAYVTSGPYALGTNAGRLDLRLDGKIFAFSLSGSAIGNNFRLGLCRLDVQPSGARR